MTRSFGCHRSTRVISFSSLSFSPLHPHVGMTCFAWHNANTNNITVGRGDYVAAGVLGVMTILTGVLYLVDFFWVIYRKAVIGDEDPMGPAGYY